MRHDVLLSGEGLRLRPFRMDASDASFLRAMAADPSARQWSYSLRRIHDEGPESWLRSRWERADVHEWVVTTAQDGAAVGRAGLHRLGPEADIEVGYWTLAGSRGTGVARRAARLVAAYAHDGLGQRRVGLLHATANPASCRAALAASFRLEGRSRALLDHGDGVLWDAHRHARLAEDDWGPVALVVPGQARQVAGADVVLRPWHQADAAVVLRAACDGVWPSGPSQVRDLAGAARWLAERVVWDAYVSWAVCASPGDLPLGGVTLRQLDAAAGSAEVEYWFVTEAAEQRVAGEAVAAAARFACADLGLRRVTLRHAADRAPACQVARVAGFAFEGELQGADRSPDGRRVDAHLHALVGPVNGE